MKHVCPVPSPQCLIFILTKTSLFVKGAYPTPSFSQMRERKAHCYFCIGCQSLLSTEFIFTIHCLIYSFHDVHRNQTKASNCCILFFQKIRLSVCSLKIRHLFFSPFISMRIVSWILKMLLWFLLMKVYLYIPVNCVIEYPAYVLPQIMAPIGAAGTLIIACLLFLYHHFSGMWAYYINCI